MTEICIPWFTPEGADVTAVVQYKLRDYGMIIEIESMTNPKGEPLSFATPQERSLMERKIRQKLADPSYDPLAPP